MADAGAGDLRSSAASQIATNFGGALLLSGFEEREAHIDLIESDVHFFAEFAAVFRERREAGGQLFRQFIKFPNGRVVRCLIHVTARSGYRLCFFGVIFSTHVDPDPATGSTSQRSLP